MDGSLARIAKGFVWLGWTGWFFFLPQLHTNGRVSATMPWVPFWKGVKTNLKQRRAKETDERDGIDSF